ncbi:MAG: response regulator [Lachnospiraceae bacterium]|nr:response regulator [Candidatus Colinaster scatohippi]
MGRDNLFDDKEIGELLALSQIGLWRVEFEEGKAPCFYADKVMNELLGTPDDMSPEDRFVYHHKMIHPEDIELFDDYSRSLENVAAEITYRYIHPELGEMFVRCGGKRDYSRKELISISGTHQNISDTIRLEQDKIAERRLAEATKKAQSANEAKTAFLFNMSHDIRTPMNAIIGFTNLLEKNKNNPELFDDYIGKIKSASEFLLSLINNVLEMARIESGKIELEETAFSSKQFMESLFIVFEKSMAEKNIEFTQKVNIKHHYIYADYVRLREIYLNILSNAIKFTPEGGRISMDLLELSSNKKGYALYQCRVSDNGIGMAKEYIPYIFDEFSRERSLTDSKVAGTGVGMAIVKHLIDMMNGTISVDSELGKGTVFTITLYHRISDNIDNKGNAQSEDVSGVFKGKRILLAEDNELNAEIAMSVLEEMGFEIDWAEDGDVCVSMMKKAASDYYDLILMDIQMPNLNGYEATKQIREFEDKAKADIPIVALTANVMEEDRKKSFASGMNGHLGKPIDVNKLAQELKKYC